MGKFCNAIWHLKRIWALFKNPYNFYACLWIAVRIFLHTKFLAASSFCRIIIMSSIMSSIIMRSYCSALFQRSLLKTLYCWNRLIKLIYGSLKISALVTILAMVLPDVDKVIIKHYQDKGFPSYKIWRDNRAKRLGQNILSNIWWWWWWWWWWWYWWWWWIGFVVWLTDKRRLALFPVGTIVRDPHHFESPTRGENDLNVHKTWVDV